MLFYLFDLLMILFIFFVEINGDVEKEEEVVLDFTVHIGLSLSIIVT